MRKKTVFITGGAKRIGASMANYFHERNYKVVFHYNKSEKEAENLSRELNEKEADSCFTIQSDFSSQESIESTVNEFYKVSKEIDVLINNASSFSFLSENKFLSAARKDSRSISPFFDCKNKALDASRVSSLIDSNDTI